MRRLRANFEIFSTAFSEEKSDVPPSIALPMLLPMMPRGACRICDCAKMDSAIFVLIGETGRRGAGASREYCTSGNDLLSLLH